MQTAMASAENSPRSPGVGSTDIDSDSSHTFLDTELEVTPTQEITPDNHVNIPGMAGPVVDGHRSRSRSRSKGNQSSQLPAVSPQSKATLPQHDATQDDDAVFEQLLEQYPLNDPSGPCLHDNKPHEWYPAQPEEPGAAKTTSSAPPQISPALFWSSSSSRAINLCRSAGLSPIMFGAAASFASLAAGVQGEALTMMVASLPSHLQMRAFSLCSEARAAGAMLQHPPANQQVIKHIVNLINARLMMRSRDFYVGITENPARRFAQQQLLGYNSMDLWIFVSGQESGDMEMQVLTHVGKRNGCKNQSAGGECRSAAQPHFMYVVWKN